MSGVYSPEVFGEPDEAWSNYCALTDTNEEETETKENDD